MRPNIRIIGFKTEYVKRAGALLERDKVEFCQPGNAQKATTVRYIHELSRVKDTTDSENIAAQHAADLWAEIKPAYEAWKAGREAPELGTPLAAWPGLLPEQAEVLRTFGLRTVEEIASATTSVIQRVQLPGMVAMQENARRYLEGKDKTAIIEQLAARDDQIAALEAQMKEMREMMAEQSAARRPGRPRKVDAADMGEAAA